MTALSLTASGCVVVHGEREVLPSTTRAEAAKALEEFTDAYNAADKAYDSSLDADYVTGALGAIDAARLKAGSVANPDGNPAHTPLKLSDPKFTIVKKAGWPRWFIADATANKGGSAHWLFVFTRDSLDEPFQAAYLTLVAADDVPKFRTDADGWAEAIDANSTELAVTPKDLSDDYANYLRSGEGTDFADGAHTNGWRDQREKDAQKPGLATQYIDEPLSDGDYAPLAVRSADGGAVVFFSTRHYQKQTAAAGTSIPTTSAIDALTTGEVKQSLTLEYVSNELALDPAKGDGKVTVLSRIQGLTAAKGE